MKEFNGRKASSSMMNYSDVSPIKSINGRDVLLPEIGLSKFRE